MSMNFEAVQGNVVRGYGKDFICGRHVACGIGYAEGGKAFVAALLDGSRGDDVTVRNEVDWPEDSPPTCCLNIGFTYSGLRRLGVEESVLAAFPKAFREGPAARAYASVTKDNSVGLGDVGESDPKHWILGAPGGPQIHLLVTLYACDTERLDEITAALRGLLRQHGLTVHSTHDARALAEGTFGLVHFGYRDGFGQPQLEGQTRKYTTADPQPPMKLGDLLLGCDYRNSFEGNHAGDLPRALADNATYGAFRILYQDVAGFNKLLAKAAEPARGLTEDLVAARLVGRWRSGVPLSLSPKVDDDRGIPDDLRNAFDYVKHDGYTPPIVADADGDRCPLGAHTRRLNPRGSRVIGRPNSRRLIRRNMPYGPQLKGTKDDGKQRGLIGYFLCGDLEAQWEFIQRTYVNGSIASYGIRGTRDFVGAQPNEGGQLNVDTGGTVITKIPTLVRTRGSLYCLLPGMGGLRYLAGERA